MAASTGIHPAGMTFGYGTDGTTFTDFAELLDIDIASPKTNTVDATHSTSPSVRKESKPGWTVPGPFSATIRYKRSEQASARALRAVPGDADKYFRVVYPNADQDVWQGFVTRVKPIGKPISDDLITCRITGECNSAVTYTAGS